MSCFKEAYKRYLKEKGEKRLAFYLKKYFFLDVFVLLTNII
jgi:hypothetical protein